MSLLKAKNLSYSYSGSSPLYNDAVKNVSFDIENGEIIGIIGHTGSGKSTLVQMLNGLLKPTKGEIFLEDKNIWDLPKEIKKVRSKVGLVFQYPEYQLFEETVYKDIAYGPKNMGFTDEEISKNVYEVSRLVGIKEEYLQKSPFELSGGEKRRVAIAGVLAMNPKILILDEPMSGLDPKGREDIISIIKNYRDTKKASIIIISHNMEDMAVLADKLLVMNKGELVMFDEVDKVFAQKEKLRSIGLDVPIVTKVFEELSHLGVEINTDVYTVLSAVNEVLNKKAGV